jgi:pyruvate/2-oxoglutarate dehydrogenase complex dihydrolipoamide dehydrogenase (E3) component
VPPPQHVVVLGGGSTGTAFAAALRRLDERVRITLVERELVGGECSYWACMPSKALLRPLEAVAAARLVPGAAEAVTGEADLERVFWHRDQVVEDWDDSRQADFLAERDIVLARGTGRVIEPGLVRVYDEELPYDKLVVATGSVAAVPPIEGLAETDYWTSRQATEAREIPESLTVIGAGPVGCELAQFFRRAGARVVLADVADRLLPRGDPGAGELLREALEDEGVELRLGVKIERVARGFRVELAGEPGLRTDRLLVATGRRANTQGFGLEHLGLEISQRGIEVDDRLRAAQNVWACGDVTGIAMFTHVGKYHGRVAAADVAGRRVHVDHSAIPAVTFTDPQVASVGQTSGDALATGEWRVDRLSRSSIYERPKRPGLLKLFAKGGLIVGAVAVGPEAGEWLGQLTLAVKTRLSVDVLRDTIQPYPTFSEAIVLAARELPD